MLPLFRSNASLFHDVCDDEIRGRKIRHLLKTRKFLQLCNTERCGQTARKRINPVQETDRKSIYLSCGMVSFYFGTTFWRTSGILVSGAIFPGLFRASYPDVLSGSEWASLCRCCTSRRWGNILLQPCSVSILTTSLKLS